MLLIINIWHYNDVLVRVQAGNQIHQKSTNEEHEKIVYNGLGRDEGTHEASIQAPRAEHHRWKDVITPRPKGPRR